MKPKIVAYLRVSTQRQGASGLGLEAQRAAVKQFCDGLGYEQGAEFQEVESGRKSDRPELRKAIALAKKLGATLLIAKIDRLARSVAFIANLLEAGADVRACDMPEANRFIWHVMAAVAENEAKAISDRTRAALAAAKARGTLLGASNRASQNLTDEARRKGAESTAQGAAAFYAQLVPVVSALRDEGKSLREIASALNEGGHLTRRAKSWNPVQVRRVLERAAA